MEVNPFNSPEFKKALLGKEKGENNPDDYEILGDQDEEKDDLKSIISGAPTMPKKASNMILDASLIAKNEKEKKAAEFKASLNQIMTSYNKQYGLSLNLDLDSLSNTMALVSTDPKMTRVLELYTSKIYRNIKTMLGLKLIQSLSLLIEHITSPEYMLGSQELTLADKFLVVEKLISYIQTIGDLKDTMEIQGDDDELRKIAEKNKDLDIDSPEAKESVDEFMKLFNQEFGKSDVNKKT